jgi:transcriptional regulator with XRE-family HTH domain
MEDDELIKSKIRKTLIDCRIEKGLTQTDVGKIVGKSKTAVASWEQGLSMPDISTLYRLARYYEKTISYMYGEENHDH